MTTRTYIGRLALPLVTACLALGLPAGAAHANFMIPPFDVTEDGLSAAPNVAVQSDGTAHFMWTQSPSELQTRERGPDGSLGQIKTVAPTPTGGSQLAVDGAGNVHFVWKGQSQNGVNTIVRTRRLGADGTLGETRDLSAAGLNGYDPQIAIAPDGAVTFVWTQTAPAGAVVQGRRLAADGTLGPVQELSVAGLVGAAQVAVDDGGNAVVVWLRNNGGLHVAQGRRWAADGSKGVIHDLTETGANASDAQVEIDAAGVAHIAVQRGPAVYLGRMKPNGELEAFDDLRQLPGDTGSDPSLAVDRTGNAQVTWRAVAVQGGNVIQTRHAYPDGSYGPVQNLAHYGAMDLPKPLVAFDGQGNARHVWTSKIDAKSIVMARTVENTGWIGTMQQLSGTTAGYEGGNAYSLALATGPNGGPVAAWTHTKDQKALVVQGAAVPIPKPGVEGGAGGGGGSNTTGSEPDRAAPALSGLALRPARLVLRERGRVTYGLSEPASVVLRVVRRGTGRRVGSIRASGRAGQNRLAFRGRLRGRYLRPGRYVFVAVATDAAGNRSAPRRARFRVVRRPR